MGVQAGEPRHRRTVRCQERKIQRGGAGQCLGAETGAFFVIEHPLGDTGFLGIDFEEELLAPLQRHSHQSPPEGTPPPDFQRQLGGAGRRPR